MTSVFLIIWFYLYAGLMFAMTAYTVGLFQKYHWTVQAVLWPVFLLIQMAKVIGDSKFWWFVKYYIYKMKNPGV